MREWQFNVLFFVGVGGAVLLLLGPEFGLHISDNPTALTGVGAILTYVLTYKRILHRSPEDHRKISEEPPPKEDDGDGSR